jgi:serine/threonine-protein kinase
MARVDLAIKRVGTFRRMYAVKRLHPHLASDPEFRAMFLDEARIAGLIHHPNVVGVIDVGEDEHGPFLVMDYVDGLPLGNLAARSRVSKQPMPVQIAVRIALDVARGLGAAHEVRIDGRPLGVVHRDLSPQNVLIGFDGQARLTDFGIAKALGRSSDFTAMGVVKGKTSYLAPEQIRLEEPDRRSDLFALGVVLFEMLSGERLYKRSDEASDMRAIVQEPVPDIGELRSDVPIELVRLLFELLAKARKERPSDAQEVIRRLEAILAELISGEEAVSVADYLDLVASDVKLEQGRVIQEAIAEAERLEREQRAKSSSRTRGAVVVAGVLGVGLTLAALLLRKSEPEARSDPAPTSPVTVQMAPIVRASTAAEVVKPPPEPTREALDGPPKEAPKGPPKEAAPQKRAKKKIVRRAHAGQKPGSLPEWLDLDK